MLLVTIILLLLTRLLLWGALRRWLYARWLKISPPTNRVRVEDGIAITTDAGITLVCDHYAPVGVSNVPTILIRTPYGRNRRGSFYGGLTAFFARRFAERGYHVIVQDVRGRFDSSGEFEPYVNEQADGIATVEWLRRQTWFNGQIGTWGPSYLGITQWAIADNIPEIQAMVPIVTATRMYPIMYPDGVLNFGLLTRWLAIFHLLDQSYHGSTWAGLRTLWFYYRNLGKLDRRAPIRQMDQWLTGRTIPIWQQAMDDTRPDSPLWREINAMMDIGRVQAKVHLIGGWYDFFLREQLCDYRQLQEADNPPYLTIGGWHHFDDLNGMYTGMQAGLRWFDHHLKGRGTLRAKPVKLYHMGADKWIERDEYPAFTTEARSYHLNGDERRLQRATPDAGTAHYPYQPTDPTPSVGGAEFSIVIRPVRDNRTLAARGDVLAFTSDPLAHDIDISGVVRVVLFVQSTALTCDFVARLCDVQADGRSLNICDGFVHIANHADTVQQVDIYTHPTLYRFKRGHRLQVLVSSGAHPRWLRNHGTLEPFADAATLLACQQTVFYGGDKPSQLILPVIAGASRDTRPASNQG